MSYGKKVAIDGIVFDSRLEARRYLDLRNLQRAGLISDLKTHVNFEFIINGYKIGEYHIDFTYFDREKNVKVGEEAKGRFLRDCPLRRNLFIALFPEYEFRLFTGKAKLPRMHLPKKVKSKT